MGMMRNGYELEDLSLPQQNYMETIAEFVRQEGHARTTDVAHRLGVSLPSASEAVKRLADMGLVRRESRFQILLTGKGKRVADSLDQRHRALKRFMVDVMAMREEKADAVACRVEHCVDGEFAERICRVAEFLEQEYPWTLKGIVDSVRNGRVPQPHREWTGFQI